jgi:hypothetical protein
MLGGKDPRCLCNIRVTAATPDGSALAMDTPSQGNGEPQSVGKTCPKSLPAAELEMGDSAAKPSWFDLWRNNSHLEGRQCISVVSGYFGGFPKN